jgi:hypothetical protein
MDDTERALLAEAAGAAEGGGAAVGGAGGRAGLNAAPDAPDEVRVCCCFWVWVAK